MNNVLKILDAALESTISLYPGSSNEGRTVRLALNAFRQALGAAIVADEESSGALYSPIISPETFRAVLAAVETQNMQQKQVIDEQALIIKRMQNIIDTLERNVARYKGRWQWLTMQDVVVSYVHPETKATAIISCRPLGHNVHSDLVLRVDEAMSADSGEKTGDEKGP